MRFPFLALLAALSTSCTDAAKHLNADQLNDLIKSGKVDTNSLLKNAVPYKKHIRRLEQGADGDADAEGEAEAEAEAEEEGYTGYLKGGEIKGDLSVSFNSCITLGVEQDVDGDIEEYMYDGTIRSIKSYVLFNVCNSEKDCFYRQDDQYNTYMVELNTWVDSMVTYLPDKYDEYCQGCRIQQNYCMSSASYTAGNIDYSTAFFFYNDVKYQLIDCNQCFAFDCFDDNNAYEENDWEGVSEWMDGISQCADTGARWHDMNLYGGWVCNAAGTGMEIAVFVDEDCTLYNSAKSYGRLLGNGAEEWGYYAKSTEVVSYIFNTRFDCYGGDITYVNLMQQVYLEEGEYDPCKYDNTTKMVLDYQECYQMLNEIPCYDGRYEYAEQMMAGYEQYGYFEYNEDADQDVDADAEEGDANGDANGDRRKRRNYRRYLENNGGDNQELSQECQEFMSFYPCWTMPGDEVSADYQEACEEYKDSFRPQANEACTSLFQGGDFEVNSLSDCANVEANNAEDENAEQDQQGQQQEYNSAFYYDIYKDDADDVSAVCTYIEGIYIGDYEPVEPGYDEESSGTLYSDEDKNKNGGGYFPTINLDTMRTPKKLGTAGIVMLALLCVVCSFMLVCTITRLRNAYRRKQIADMRDSRDVPFLS